MDLTKAQKQLIIWTIQNTIADLKRDLGLSANKEQIKAQIKELEELVEQLRLA